MTDRKGNRVLVIGIVAVLSGTVLIGGAAFLLTHPSPDPPPTTLTGRGLGTTFRVSYRESSTAPIDAKIVRIAIATEIDSVDRVFSNWRDDSLVSQFNRFPPGTFFISATGFVDLSRLAERLRDRTDGAFDVTAGRLTTLWRDRTNPGRLYPPEDEWQAALYTVGRIPITDRVGSLNAPPGTRQRSRPRWGKYPASIAKAYPDYGFSSPHLDFSAIAKGYAVDRIAESLDTLGATEYMIELGGEIRVKGTSTLGIEAPVPGVRRIMHTVDVTDAALATSGDYRNFVERNGKRYSHIIDPRTGYPIDHDLASASVIADTCAEADALATALMVMGPVDAHAFAEREKLGVLLITRVKNDDGTAAFATWMSPAWPK